MSVQSIKESLVSLAMKLQRIEDRDENYQNNSMWQVLRKKQDKLYILLAEEQRGAKLQNKSVGPVFLASMGIKMRKPKDFIFRQKVNNEEDIQIGIN